MNPSEVRSRTVSAPQRQIQPSDLQLQRGARKWGGHGLKVTSPAPREMWLELYRQDVEALPSQSPEWIDCICALGGYQDASRLYEFSDGQQLLMPAVKRRGLPAFASVGASLPHAWGVGGLIARRSIRPEDLGALFEDLAHSSFLSMRLLPNPRQGKLWQAAQPSGVIDIPRRAHIINLEGGFDQVWQKCFTAGARNFVRRAEKANLRVECDTTGRLVPVFYELFRRSVNRWAEQQHEPRWLAQWRTEHRDPLHKLEHIAQHMGEACRVWVAWQDNQPAASILAVFGHNADYMMGAMDKELAAPTRASYLLQKLAIEEACREGCHLYHMGESGASAGISQFKERFGAQAYPYNEFRIERFPLSRLDRGLRSMVKRAIGFKDVVEEVPHEQARQ